MTKQEKVLMTLGILIYSLLTIFSYAYVDLNLTLSQNSTALAFVSFMQILGYFQRSLSTKLYILIVSVLFSYLLYHLYLAAKGSLSIKYVFKIVIVLSVLSALAYPFLSSDVFNYLFDAKIVLKYHLNPYTHRAMDFPNDDWVRFMRWIHRYSPYGPMWLILSIFPAFFSFGKFTLNLLLFKILMAAFHILNTYLIYSILRKINPSKVIFGVSLYGLNPLFIIEGIINAHNDVVIASFMLLSIYLVINKNHIASFVSLIIGFLMKYFPILNLPWLILFAIRNKLSIKTFILLNILTMIFFTFIYSTFKVSVPFVSSGATQTQFQPWYLFWTVPLLVLTLRKDFIAVALALSIGALMRYLPYLYWGDWSHNNTIIFMQATTIAPAIAVAFFFLVKEHLLKK
ncbi:MAG: hypothetical protein AAB512_01585 [Patescibacteria group bacterium]